MKKLLVIAAVLFLNACSSTKGNWDYDPQVNFNQYKTYAWVHKKTGDEGYQLDGLMEKRIHNAVENQMMTKGIKKVANTSAELLVNYITKTDKKIDVDTFHTNYGYYPNSYPNWWWGGSTQTQTSVREYEVSTLLVDFVDAKTKKLIWRGAIKDTVKKNKTPQQKTEIINQKISKLLANFPPKPEASK
ncbi:DUF4136 domain-containing protein [Shewanella sp. 202IG2-18]|uniref:DUF4136 domain-containing protein n=1 Tax=Parashewanella hymeniacidonis TaxID=2807618 RepID=UPI0019617B57|nr:DUF4136 domain-containing protein [Parashewanella hymeniacidonis]MBM7072134.1 DUF4136 domain-containing protein [Parashewanella hymeniacidonis]